MFKVLRHRNFGLLWVGGVISLIGDWMLFVGLPVFVYSLTNSALATGLTFMIETLPKVLGGSVAGVFVDRWNRKRVMVFCDVIRAIAVSSLLLVQSADMLWLVYIVAAVISLTSQFFNPAEQAMIPHLVSEDLLMAANSTAAVGANLTRLIGPAIAGGLIHLLGFRIVLIIDTVSFLVSGLLISMIIEKIANPAHEESSDQTATGWGSIWRDWIAGLKIVRQSRIVSTIFLIVALIAPAEGIIQVLFVIFVDNNLGGGAEKFGLLLTAQGIGGLTASLLISKLGDNLTPRRLIGISAILNGFILIGIFNFASFPVALGLFVLAGFPIVALMVSVQTLLQKSVPSEYLGRIFGSFSTTMAIMGLVGMGAASFLTDFVGLQPMLNVNAVLFILTGIVALTVMPREADVPAAMIEPEPIQAG